MNDLTTLIFGASSGIGLECVKRFSVTAPVVAVSRKCAPDELEGNDNVVWCQYSSECSADPEKLAHHVKTFIRARKQMISAVVLNAGALEVEPALAFTSSSVSKMMRVNFLNHIFLTRSLVMQMLKNGGSVVGISSSAAENFSTGRAIYNASKRAFEAYLLTLGHEIGSRNVRVNVVRPGLTDTELMHATTPKSGIEEYLQNSALGRINSTLDVVDVVEFLVSDAARGITCSVVPVHGGARL